MPREKNKNASNKNGKDKKTPIVDETFRKNIIFKEVLTPMHFFHSICIVQILSH
jgi:hypothetical protein